MKQNENGSISKFIQSVFNSYSQSFNKITGHSGTLFQGRAKGIEVDTDKYAVQLCRYIHTNPLAAKLVGHPQEWEQSDFLVWTGKKEGQLTNLHLRDGYFGSAEEYERFVDEHERDNSLKIYLFDE